MVHARRMLVAVAIGSGFFVLGCSQSTSRNPIPTAGETRHESEAETSDGAGRNVAWWRDEAILAELQLTDDQLQAIHEIMNESARREAEHQQKERQLSISYLRTLAQEPVDPKVADNVGERLIEALSERGRSRIENLRDLRGVLSGEQWAKLWVAEPRALQIGRYRIVRGPKISFSADHDETNTTSP